MKYSGMMYKGENNRSLANPPIANYKIVYAEVNH